MIMRQFDVTEDDHWWGHRWFYIRLTGQLSPFEFHSTRKTEYCRTANFQRNSIYFILYCKCLSLNGWKNVNMFHFWHQMEMEKSSNKIASMVPPGAAAAYPLYPPTQPGMHPQILISAHQPFSGQQLPSNPMQMGFGQITPSGTAPPQQMGFGVGPSFQSQHHHH